MIHDVEVSELRRVLTKILQEDLSLARVNLDDDGDINFHYEGQKHIVFIDVDDASYLRIMLPCIHFVGEYQDDEIRKVDRAIVEANYICKAAKISRTVSSDKDGEYVVCATVEFLISSLDALDPQLLERYLTLLKSGSNKFRSDIKDGSFVQSVSCMQVGPSGSLH